MKEKNLIKTFLPEWQKENGKESYLCRNNTGSAYQGQVISEGADFITLKKPRFITFGVGLMKKIKKVFKPVGGGDLIGWTSMCIPGRRNIKPCISEKNCTEYIEMRLCVSCPFKFAIFTSIELKTKDVPETEDQIKWENKVIEAGGIAKVVREDE